MKWWKMNTMVIVARNTSHLSKSIFIISPRRYVCCFTSSSQANLMAIKCLTNPSEYSWDYKTFLFPVTYIKLNIKQQQACQASCNRLYLEIQQTVLCIHLKGGTTFNSFELWFYFLFIASMRFEQNLQI